MLSFFIRANFLFILLSYIGIHSFAGTPIITQTIYRAHQPSTDFLVDIEITEGAPGDFGQHSGKQFFTLGFDNDAHYKFVSNQPFPTINMVGGGSVPDQPKNGDIIDNQFTFSYLLDNTTGTQKIQIIGLRVRKTDASSSDVNLIRKDITLTLGAGEAYADINNLPKGSSTSLATIVSNTAETLLTLGLNPNSICAGSTPTSIEFTVQMAPGAVRYRLLEYYNNVWNPTVVTPINGKFTQSFSSTIAVIKTFKVVADLELDAAHNNAPVSWIEGEEELLTVTAPPAVPNLSKVTSDNVCLDATGGAHFDFQINNYDNTQTYILKRKSPTAAVIGPVTGINSSGVFTCTITSQSPGNQVYYVTIPAAGGCAAVNSQDVPVTLANTPVAPDLSKLTTDKVCLDNSPSGNGNFDFVINNYQSGTTYSLQRVSPGTQDFGTITGISSSGVFNHTLTNVPSTDRIYHVSTTSNGCTATSQDVTVQMAVKPVITLKGTIISPIPISTMDMPRLLDGVNGLFNPTGMTFSFSIDPTDLTNFEGASTALESAGGSLHQFNPYGIKTFGDIHVIVNGTLDGCAADPITIIFKVRDGSAMIPSFVKPISKMPICENYPNNRFDLIGYVRNCGFTPSAPGFTITAYYKTGPTTTVGVNVPYTYAPAENLVDGSTTTDYAYAFSINPLRHFNYVVQIVISAPIGGTCSTSRALTGYIPINPRRAPFLTGLPLGETIFAPLCSASHDTILMNANPSRGIYKYYKGNINTIPSGSFVPESLVGTKLIKLNTSIHAVNPPDGDESLEKFVPNDVFKNRLSSNFDSVIVVEYIYPNSSGSCPDTTIRILNFNRAIDVTTIVPDKICFGDTLKLNVNYGAGITPNEIAQDAFYWSFGDGFTIKKDVKDKELYNYKNPGLYPVRFKTFMSKLPPETCNNDILDTVRVGALPIVDFEVRKNFIDSFTVFKTLAKIEVPSISDVPGVDEDIINSWEYKFGTPGGYFINHLNGNTTFKFPTDTLKTPYEVIHIATAKYGCKDSAIYYVPIFPINNPKKSKASIDSFDVDDKNGWFESGQYKVNRTKSSWINDTPKGKTIKDSIGIHDAWLTFNSTDTTSFYNANERSWVESPVYNLSQLDLPMVSLSNFVNSELNSDGVSLQYAFCDTSAFGHEVWNTIGDEKTGLNWYKSKLIYGLKDDQFKGWSGIEQKNWQFSAYGLSQIKKAIKNKQSLVRFRLIFGSNGNNDADYGKFEGFAFDNFFVGERNRKVLIEEFCDYKRFDKGDLTKDKLPYDTLQGYYIQYHSGTWTNNDVIFNARPDEPSARALHYGVGKFLPRGVIDGIIYDNKDSLGLWGPKAYDNRSLIVSPINMTVTADLDVDSILIHTEITNPDKSLENRNLLLHVAIVEKAVNGNGATFANVLRGMVPNAAGTRIDKTLSLDGTLKFDCKWKPFTEPNSDFNIIAYIQDEDTKEIYQASKVIVKQWMATEALNHKKSGEVTETNISFNEMSIQPNPIAEDLRVVFNGILNSNYDYLISDSFGRIVSSGTLNSGINAAFIETQGLKPGIYNLTLRGEGRAMMQKFAVVR